MKRTLIALACAPLLVVASLSRATDGEPLQATAADLAHQNSELKEHTLGKGFGPQSPRDLSSKAGSNHRHFSPAPQPAEMNLCNIHFHNSAEHKGGEFTTFAGYGDGHGFHTGYVYNGKLGAAEATPLPAPVCVGEHGSLNAGDTIEVHYVHSTADVKPGQTLAACLTETDKNPQLRVESQVMVLVNDPKAADFKTLTAFGEKNGYQQALHIPANTGRPVQYAGSTTGPNYDEQGSPLQVTWNVRPKVLKVNAASVGEWCSDNAFKENHAHGVRNLVIEPELLSEIR